MFILIEFITFDEYKIMINQFISTALCYSMWIRINVLDITVLLQISIYFQFLFLHVITFEMKIKSIIQRSDKLVVVITKC